MRNTNGVRTAGEKGIAENNEKCVVERIVKRFLFFITCLHIHINASMIKIHETSWQLHNVFSSFKFLSLFHLWTVSHSLTSYFTNWAPIDYSLCMKSKFAYSFFTRNSEAPGLDKKKKKGSNISLLLSGLILCSHPRPFYWKVYFRLQANRWNVKTSTFPF